MEARRPAGGLDALHAGSSALVALRRWRRGTTSWRASPTVLFDQKEHELIADLFEGNSRD